jgi:hypothetical protein
MALLPTLPPNVVAMVLTDIPYGAVSRPSSGLRNLDKGDADITTFSLEPFVAELVRVCAGSCYVFCEFAQVSPVATAFRSHGLTIRIGVWQKTNPSPMNGKDLWLSALELCVFARKGGATFTKTASRRSGFTRRSRASGGPRPRSRSACFAN